MGAMLGIVIRVATAPLRLFARSPGLRWGLGGAAVLAASFVLSLWALDRLMPADSGATPAQAALPALPPLQPVTKSSYVIAPVAITLAAIRHSLDAAAPRQLAGKDDNPVSSLLSKADIGITVARGALALDGKPNELTIATPLNGTLRVTGQIATQAGNITGSITGLLSRSLAKDVGGFTSKVLDQRAEVRGQVTMHARPALTANWRLLPNLTGEVTLHDSALTLAGFKIDVAREARPLIEREVNAQVSALQTRLRNDAFIERTARAQWAKMCRSIPLGGGATGLPTLWLEMRPVRAAAAQPQIDGRDVTLTVGVQAETRITARQSHPDCPFPARLELVPPMENGKLSLGVPIDVPFSELNKLLEAQLKGQRFGDKAAPVEIEVRSAHVAAAGNRLLIALGVKAREKKSWFGFGAQATVQIWGKPVLDADSQILRLTDLSLAVDSQAGFGLLGAAARAALPYLQQALAEHAVVDLKPFAADAQKKIGLALADFRQNGKGVRVDANVDDLRLTGIAFDSHTLRVIAQATGSAKVAVNELPRM